MPMRIDDKKVAVEELKDIANNATSAVAADYHGASVTESVSYTHLTLPTKRIV